MPHAKTPQYDLPDLRGKQRRKDFLVFYDRKLGNKVLTTQVDRLKVPRNAGLGKSSF